MMVLGEVAVGVQQEVYHGTPADCDLTGTSFPHPFDCGVALQTPEEHGWPKAGTASICSRGSHQHVQPFAGGKMSLPHHRGKPPVLKHALIIYRNDLSFQVFMQELSSLVMSLSIFEFEPCNDVYV